MLQTKSLLIIEDDPDLRMTLEYFLGRIGYEVLSAKRGEDGLKLCLQKKPQAVLCDIALPGMDGYEVCKRIKGDPVTQNIVVIFISAKGASEIQTDGAKACADFYITKPVDPNDVGADLYVLFEAGFVVSDAELRQLRVTKRIPGYAESKIATYAPHDVNTPHLNPPPVTHDAPVYERPAGSPAGVAQRRPAAAAPSPTASASPSSLELHQVHDLLQALKNSLRDTSQRLDAILQYIEVIDKE